MILEHWIDGAARASIDGQTVELAQGARAAAPIRVARGGAADVDGAVQAAAAATSSWRSLSAKDRGRMLRAASELIRERVDDLVEEEVLDTGKPRSLAAAEISGAADYFEFYSTLVNLPVGDVLDVQPGLHVHTVREPYGVVGIITPWNLPMNQAARAVAPALAAANTVVLKPAEVTPTTSVRMAEVLRDAGVPAGVFNVVLGQGSVAGMALVRHPAVRKLAFTGSVPVGREIGRVAAERVLPLTLELGGKSACIVFEDADLDLASREVVRAFTTNAGQVCSSGTRLLVEESIREDLVSRVAQIVADLREGEHIGPLITDQQARTVRDYLSIAEQEGANPVVGGRVADERAGEKCFIPPTVYDRVTNDMRIAREEIFGPVLAVISFTSEGEAVRLANDSDFGLVGGVFSGDVARGLRVASQLEVGQAYVNSWSTQSVEMPFGGHKLSGYGREKGIEAINHYSQVKSISLNLGAIQ